MIRCLVPALAAFLPTLGAAQTDGAASPGRTPGAPEMFLRTGEAVTLCLRPERQWQDFCNGLVQGYAEYAVLAGRACIPFGVTRRHLVEGKCSLGIHIIQGFNVLF